MDKTAVMYISNEATLGGAARSLIEMLSALKASVKPYVILPGCGILEKELGILEIEYAVVPFSLGYGLIGSHSRQDEDRNFMDNFRAAVKIAELARMKNVKIIHSNTSVSNVGAFVSLLLDIPHIWHLREFLQEDFGCELWDMTLKRKLFQQTDVMLSISRCLQVSYQEKYGLASQAIYDGLDIMKYIRPLEKEPENKINTFLLAGNISAGKGQFDAVRALELIINKGMTDVRLIMIGNGTHNYLWGMKRYIRQHGLNQFIEFVPFQEDLALYREQADFAIVSSRMEALGRVTVEAMLAGNIVIGADTGGTYELIGSEQERGYLYHQGHCESLAEKMEEAIRNLNSRNRDIRKNAQDFAKEHFGIETYSEKLTGIYENLMDTWGDKDRQSRKDLQKNLEKRYENSIDIDSTCCENKEDSINGKFRQMFYMADKWLKIKLRGISLSKYFQDRGFRIIAVYGLGYLGCDLIDELEDSHVSVSYVIDQNYAECCYFINAVSPSDEFEKVDAVLVTVAGEEEKIIEFVKSKGAERVITLKEVLDSFQV